MLSSPSAVWLCLSLRAWNCRPYRSLQSMDSQSRRGSLFPPPVEPVCIRKLTPWISICQDISNPNKGPNRHLDKLSCRKTVAQLSRWWPHAFLSSFSQILERCPPLPRKVKVLFEVQRRTCKSIHWRWTPNSVSWNRTCNIVPLEHAFFMKCVPIPKCLPFVTVWIPCTTIQQLTN